MSVEDTLTKARDRAKQMGLPYDGALTPAEAYEVMTSKLVRVSSAPVGSSARMMRGSFTSARAIATRCCCPPESWAG